VSIRSWPGARERDPGGVGERGTTNVVLMWCTEFYLICPFIKADREGIQYLNYYSNKKQRIANVKAPLYLNQLATLCEQKY
jgi:hypothetical protein